MKRNLLQAKLRLQSGIKRLEDLGCVYPEFHLPIKNVIDMDLARALDDLDYALSVD